MKLPSASPLLIAVASSVASSELRPLSTIINTDFEVSYLPTRCGALFMSMARWAGEDQLGSETYKGLLTNAETLLQVAGGLRSDATGSSPEQGFQNAINDSVAIGQIYLEQYQTSYVTNGTAWDSDDLFNEDLEICSSLMANR